MVVALQMYLGQQMIDSVEINLTGYGKNDKAKLNLAERINELKRKHRDLIEKANAEPVFYLGNIPSSIHTFRSLKDRYGGGGGVAKNEKGC